MSCLVMSCHVWSCLVMPGHVWSCLVMSYLLTAPLSVLVATKLALLKELEGPPSATPSIAWFTTCKSSQVTPRGGEGDASIDRSIDRTRGHPPSPGRRWQGRYKLWMRRRGRGHHRSFLITGVTKNNNRSISNNNNNNTN